MVEKAENTDDKESSTSEFPGAPEEAIVKPEDERPAKLSKRPEEELPGDENKHDDEGIDDSTDMDGDGSPNLSLVVMKLKLILHQHRLFVPAT